MNPFSSQAQKERTENKDNIENLNRILKGRMDYRLYEEYLKNAEPKNQPIASAAANHERAPAITKLQAERKLYIERNDIIETHHSMVFPVQQLGQGASGDVYKAIKINKKHADGNLKTPT
jgi:hypothetical protein